MNFTFNTEHLTETLHFAFVTAATNSSIIHGKSMFNGKWSMENRDYRGVL